LRGHEYLLGLIPEFPEIKIVWRPCEAHPRPESHGPHSDLMIMGMFCAVEAGADILAYHKLMYDAVHKDKINIERAAALSEYAAPLLDAVKFKEALENRVYAAELDAANDHAYEKSGVWYIPAFRMNGKKLDSVGGSGVTAADLAAFMRDASRGRE